MIADQVSSSTSMYLLIIGTLFMKSCFPTHGLTVEAETQGEVHGQFWSPNPQALPHSCTSRFCHFRTTPSSRKTMGALGVM